MVAGGRQKYILLPSTMQIHISEISTVEGASIKGHVHLKQAARSHFQLLFQEDGLSVEEGSVDFLENIPSLVSSEDNKALLEPFSKQEVMEVTWAMEPDKATK